MNDNYTYLLIETADEMEQTIEHIDKVIDEQNELVEVINSNEKAEKFKSFCEVLTLETNATLEQRDSLSSRLQMLNNIIFECQNDEKIANMITLFCKAFNVFGNTDEKSDSVEND